MKLIICCSIILWQYFNDVAAKLSFEPYLKCQVSVILTLSKYSSELALSLELHTVISNGYQFPLGGLSTYLLHLNNNKKKHR